KYVSEEDEKKETKLDQKNVESIDNDKVIKLDQTHVLEHNDVKKQIINLPNMSSQATDFYEEKSTLAEQVTTVEQPKKSSSPFEKLAETMKSQRKNNTTNKDSKIETSLTIDQFLAEIASQVIEKWTDSNMRKIVEEIVMKEIEKIKSE
ncbi:MAG: DUF2497 domain-containing protein, partial [Holosporales bacterium]|nr:DUF2497 domain-containing protein [Holosporales bacterium]